LNHCFGYPVEPETLVMKNPWVPVGVVTAILFFYTGLIAVGGSYTLIMSIFVASPFLIIWMVYRVLRAAPVSDKTFTDHFYEDHAYKRVPEEA
jgi:hypothetical protein